MKVGTNETISENFSEKKRGRPRLLHPEMEMAARHSKPHCDIRTLQNEDYEARAISVLGIRLENPLDFPFLWLADFSKSGSGKAQRRWYRKTILAELGRIADDFDLIEAATEICSRKPKTQDAIKMIRGWRLGRASVPVTLESTLRKAIESYRKNHSDVTDNHIYESLSCLEEEYMQKSMFGNQ